MSDPNWENEKYVGHMRKPPVPAVSTLSPSDPEEASEEPEATKTRENPVSVAGATSDDQCPECRCAPGAEHHPECPGMFPEPVNIANPVNIPLQQGNDDCPECCADSPSDGEISTTLMQNTDHEATAIPLAEQLALFEQRKWSVLESMRRELDDPEFIAMLFDEARERMAGGFPQYGSTMFRWTYHELFANQLQEVADRLVYGVADAAAQ